MLTFNRRNLCLNLTALAGVCLEYQSTSPVLPNKFNGVITVVEYKIIGVIKRIQFDKENQLRIMVCATEDFFIKPSKLLTDKCKDLNIWIPSEEVTNSDRTGDCVEQLKQSVLPLPQTTWFIVNSDKLSRFVMDQFKSSTRLLFTMFYAGERNGFILKSLEMDESYK